MRKVLGQYVVVDSGICHGRATFTGTRIMVAQVLYQIARGEDGDAIVKSWGGAVSKEAIAEAAELAREAFLDQHEAGIERICC